MKLFMTNGRARFIFKLDTLIHKLIFVKINFHPAANYNDNAVVAMRKYFVQRKRRQQPHPLKKIKGIEDLIYWAPTFLFFTLLKLTEFCVTQNETPKMVKIVQLH